MPNPNASMFAITAAALGSLLLSAAASFERRIEPLVIDHEPTLTLTRIVETRASDVVKAKDDEMVFMMPSEQPGLSLKFSLQLPAGAKVMQLLQPKVVAASDSVGTDLSKIEPGFQNELEYVELEHDFKDDDDASEVTMRLACPARAAKTFDVNATFDATIFTGVKPLSIDVGMEWLSLPADAAKLGKPPRVRANVTDQGLTFEPAEIEAWIEKIEIQIGPNEVIESNGWSSDGSSIIYSFPDLPQTRPLKTTLTLRTGVKAVPLSVALKGQALP